MQILIRDQNSLKNIGLIFEAWLDTTLEHIDTIYGVGTTKYNNFLSLRSEYKISKITTTDLSETNNYFSNRANQQLAGLIEQLKRERNSYVAKQKQEEEERKQKEEQEKNKPIDKSYSEKLKPPKPEQMERKYYKIGIALFWGVAIPMIAGIFYFGYFVGTAKFDKEKNDYYEEIKSLKKDTSKLVEQLKLKESLIKKYEALTVAFFNQPGELPTLTIVNSKIPCFEGPINECWKESVSADAGDTIAIQIYYKNTSFGIAKATTIGLKPMKSFSTNRVVFFGGIASVSGPRTTGQTTLEISSKKNVVYIPKSAKWYKTLEEIYPVDDESLFGSGFNIGIVTPGTQGVIVAFFKVSDN